MFTQPLQESLSSGSNFLLAGAGGGYDIFGALPIAQELRRAGKAVHFASLSFTALSELFPDARVEGHQNLFRVCGNQATDSQYCPEAWLSRWLEQRHRSQPQPVWCFEKCGVQPLRSAYRHLIELLEVDTVVLVDGGIDAILRGDEASLGTPSEDLTSIAAVAGIPGVSAILACVGFGAELRDDIAHSQALERIAALTSHGHFLGSVALLNSMPSVQYYREALNYVFENQAGIHRSHIHLVVSCAIDGEFGYVDPNTWVSPLANMAWFFDLPAVANAHLFLGHLEDTQHLSEVVRLVQGIRKSLQIRSASVIPL